MASSMSFGYSYGPGNPPFVGQRTRGAGLPDNGLLLIGRRVTSLAEEQPNLFEKSVGGRLIFQEQMILALKSDEVGTGNACSQPPPRLEWSNEITSHMHDQCRRLHFSPPCRPSLTGLVKSSCVTSQPLCAVARILPLPRA
jgi:hypothetical protein